MLRRLLGRSGVFERYKLEGEIARGAMGAILRVWDEDLQRHLAMKVVLGHGELLPSEKAPPVYARRLARFLEEAQVTSQLDHPGIVPVHELGLDSKGCLYFTMKLVKGKTLKEVFDELAAGEGGWTQARVLGLLQKVCEAMAYAHHKGVIHRDLKPANVMVGRFGEVYVMDWGLARVLDRPDPKDLRIRPETGGTSEVRSVRREAAAETPDSPLVTMDGDVVGTPSFMSPEQAAGRVNEMGPPSDVYAVGAMIYQMLAGQMPYCPPGARLNNYAIWRSVQEGPPTPLEELVHDAPAELVAICMRSMTRDPAHRYADMSALAEDLSAFLEHRVVSAYRTGAVAELRKWVERNKALAGSMAASVLALVAGMGASWLLKEQSDRNAALAKERGDTLASTNRSLEAKTLESDERRREAEAQRDDVLKLSALQNLDDLVTRADKLWPAAPENIERYQHWLRDAEELLDKLPGFEAKLAELRTKAPPLTEAEQAAQRASHPKLPELESSRRHLEHYRKLRAALVSSEPLREPTPQEVGVALSSLPANANDVNNLAWPLIDPDRKDWGGEAKGLVLARRAVALAAELPPAKRAEFRDSLSWALFANGHFNEAVAEEKRALEESALDRKQEFQGYLEKLEKKIEEVVDPAKDAERANHIAALEQQIAELEGEISQRLEWLFTDAQDKWWHDQLVKLVDGLKAFSDARTGLFSKGISPEHGWGVEKRLGFSQTIEERSIRSVEASARWSRAIASIANVSECPKYGGLRLAPQLGLLPIGRDSDSGLWEFAHLATGEPASRGQDGRLLLEEQTGLVFVLLPGGKFLMGAQSADPAKPNYDPQARSNEGPVHEVTLSPFFLSKYEMTQGQWLRVTGRNPSFYRPPSRLAPSLLHPVEQVSWTSCRAALDRMGLALPTEAEWEYGARGGTTSVWWTGNDRQTLIGTVNLADQAARRAEVAWFDIQDWPELDDGYGMHAPVDHYAPNPCGLHNVHGNVWEWCLDGYAAYGPYPQNDPVTAQGASAYLVVRGGGYRHRAFNARSAARNFDTADYAGSWFGIRPARRVLH